MLTWWHSTAAMPAPVRRVKSWNGPDIGCSAPFGCEKHLVVATGKPATERQPAAVQRMIQAGGSQRSRGGLAWIGCTRRPRARAPGLLRSLPTSEVRSRLTYASATKWPCRIRRHWRCHCGRGGRSLAANISPAIAWPNLEHLQCCSDGVGTLSHTLTHSRDPKQCCRQPAGLGSLRSRTWWLWHFGHCWRHHMRHLHSYRHLPRVRHAMLHGSCGTGGATSASFSALSVRSHSRPGHVVQIRKCCHVLFASPSCLQLPACFAPQRTRHHCTSRRLGTMLLLGLQWYDPATSYIHRCAGKSAVRYRVEHHGY
jgi:hypothetical protein